MPRTALLTGSVGGMIGAIMAIIGMVWSIMTLQLASDLADYQLQRILGAIIYPIYTFMSIQNSPLNQIGAAWFDIFSLILAIILIVSCVLISVGFHGMYQERGGGALGVVILYSSIVGSAGAALLIFLGCVPVVKYGIGITAFGGSAGGNFIAILGYAPYLTLEFLLTWIGIIILAVIFIVFGVASITVRGSTGRPGFSLTSGISSIIGASLFFPYTLFMLENRLSEIPNELSGNAVAGILSTLLGFVMIFVASTLWAVVFYSSWHLRKEPVLPEIKIKNTPRFTTTSLITNCLYCSSEIPENAKVCPSCGADRVRCPVCNLSIVSGELFVKCPYCGVLSHRDHLLEWIKIRGICPNCKKKLGEIEIA